MLNRRLATLAALGLLAVAGAAPPLLISNARIELGDGRVLERASILIEGGKIVKIGPDLAAIGTAQIIDGKGLTVYPGFIDAYSTRGVRVPDAPAAGTPPDSRTTAPAFMWDGNRKGIRADVEAAKSLDAKSLVADYQSQGVVAVQFAPGVGTIRGRSAVALIGAEPTVVKPGVAMEIAGRGGAGEGYPGSLMGVLALLRQTLLDAQSAKARQAKADPIYDALQPIFGGSLPVLFTADNERELGRALSFGQEFRLKLILNAARDAWRVTDRVKAANAPVVARIDLGDEPQGDANTPAPIIEERKADWRDRVANVRVLRAAGIPVAFSADGDPVSGYLRNVRRQVKAGLSRQDALDALTRTPAEILGLTDRLGVLAEGKEANLTLMTGDFAADGTTVDSVVVAGTHIPVAKKEANK